MKFAGSISRLRVERIVSQRELARQTGLYAITLVRLEAGAPAPSTGTVRSLASALRIEPGGLTSTEKVAEGAEDTARGSSYDRLSALWQGVPSRRMAGAREFRVRFGNGRA